MGDLVKPLIEKAPNLAIVFGIIFLIIYLLREYRRVREEIATLVEQRVNEKLGEVTSLVEAKISHVNILITELNEKHDQIDKKFDSFNTEKLENYANEKSLTEVEEFVSSDSLEEYSARDLLGLVQSTESTKKKAEYCQHILGHQDATAKELELAGDMMRKANRYTLAMQLYEKAHQKDPERISPYIELLCLTAELEHGKREESIEKAKQLVFSKPTRNGFARVANALIYLDRYQELSAFSDEFIKKLEGKNPKLKALALRNKAVALKEFGDIPAAMEAFQKAFEISPEDENIIKPYLGLLEEQGKDEERMGFIKKLIELDPANVNYYRFYIDALLKKKQYAEAIEWIGKAEQLVLTEIDKAMLGMYKQKAEAANNALQRTR